MIETLLAKIGSVFVGAALFLTGVFAPAPSSEPLGVALPSGTAVFETSLAAPISSSATTMTITANSVRGGGSLSGYQCFTIDEGSAQSEYVCGTVATTTVTSLERGLSPADGVTEDTDLKFAHRRGASVKITDFPLIQRLASQNSGTGTFASAIKYASSVATATLATDGQNIASVAYANSLSFGAVAQSSEAAGGFVELATGAEAASSTLSGTAARLVLSTAIATSAAPSSGNVVVVTGDDGNIDSGFIPDLFGSTTLRTYNATSTWTKPASLKRIDIWVCGAGGNGSAGTAGSESGAGGGAGGCGFEILDATELAATSSVQIVVSLSPSGTSKFSTFCSATSGTNAAAKARGAGGTATGCDLNIPGAGGTGGSGPGGDIAGSPGGSSARAPGGGGGSTNTGSGDNGYYGSGGGGGAGSAGSGFGSGGTGGEGVVIVTEYF